MIPKSLVLLLVALLPCACALAWSRPGHMVSAAIAHEELSTRDSRIVKKIVALVEKHPDRAAFEVAAGRTTGAERNRRIFMQLARWPDDTRGSIHDHPTWHYWSRPIVDSSSPPSKLPGDEPQGSGMEAFALNLSVASDARAPAGERAVALAWLFHLVGDMHQPLHAVSQVSKRFPRGDRGGSMRFVRDPIDNEPRSLHWFWDDAVIRDGEPEAAARVATELMQRLPRSTFKQLQPFKDASEFSTWAEESRQLATTVAYGPGFRAAEAAKQAPDLSRDYVDGSKQVAEQRLALAGYRLSDILRWAFRQQER